MAIATNQGEEVHCAHRGGRSLFESVESVGGVEVATCTKCGQVRQIDQANRVAVTKLGRLDGNIVIPDAGYRLNLSSSEMDELEMAKQWGPKVPEPAEPAPAAPITAVPPKPTKRKEIWEYYESNKDALLKDYYRMKFKKFYEKWHMAASTWQKLKKLWDVKLKGRKGSKRVSSKIPPAPEPIVKKDGLPPFPAFNDDWPFLVQIEWLKTYQAIYQHEGDGNNS